MIYFLQPVDGGPVKIGTSQDVDRRREQLEAQYNRPLALLAVLPGDREEERAIHEQFDHLRFGRTEQFQPGPDLMAFIGRPLFVNATPIEEIDKPYATTKIDRRLLGIAHLIARERGISTAELLSEIVRGPLEKAHEQLVRKFDKRETND